MATTFQEKDIKHYPHFDRHLSLDKIANLVNDPESVSRNKFYPFFLYNESWKPFRKLDSDGNKPAPKSRPIRYASRRDAYIFTHYRRILSDLYEAELRRLGINHCPIAYRKILKPSGGGKCNIDFAKDAFDSIIRLENCVAIALDIKGYFENLDHGRIKDIWCHLLGTTTLPRDHYTVFKNITKYHVVDQKEVYRRLGIIQDIEANGYLRETYTIPYKKMPTQLCTPKVFREKVCGGDPNLPSLIVSNKTGRGVPQGAPISDLIANFYLIHFDATISKFANEAGGVYMRYSDDILIVLPGGEAEANTAQQLALSEIQKYGDHLIIKDEKTCVVKFTKGPSEQTFEHVRGPQGANGFEYLGFRFDGKNVYVRDSTMSRLYRKVSLTAKGFANNFANSHPDKSAEEIISTFNYSDFSQRFLKVHPDDLSPDDHATWTFYSYLKRASETFGERGKKILPQARNFRQFMRDRLKRSMEKAVQRRDSRVNKVLP